MWCCKGRSERHSGLPLSLSAYFMKNSESEIVVGY
jgi:hypothetical protein